MHETTVRFSDDLWARVRQMSKRNGTSAAQFVREATVTRIAVESHTTMLRREVVVALDRLDLRLRQVDEALQRHGLR